MKSFFEIAHELGYNYPNVKIKEDKLKMKHAITSIVFLVSLLMFIIVGIIYNYDKY